MPKKNCLDVTQEILEEARAKYPNHGFIIIAVEPIKHPDNGTPGFDQAIVSNLADRNKVIQWLGNFLTRAMFGHGQEGVTIKRNP